MFKETDPVSRTRAGSSSLSLKVLVLSKLRATTHRLPMVRRLI